MSYSSDNYPHTISDRKFDGCRPANKEEKSLLDRARSDFNSLPVGNDLHYIVDGRYQYQVKGLGNLEVTMTHIDTI